MAKPPSETISLSGEEAKEGFFGTLFEEAVVDSWEKQMRLNQYIHNLPSGFQWNVDLNKAELRLGENTFCIDMIGSESLVSGTWLWADVSLPGYDSSQRIAELRQWGRQIASMTFIQDQIQCDSMIGLHSMALIGTHKLDGCGYFVMPTPNADNPQGHFVMSIRPSALISELSGYRDGKHFVGEFRRIIDMFPEFDHRAALLAYVTQHELELCGEESRVVEGMSAATSSLSFKLSNGDKLSLTFKESGKEFSRVNTISINDVFG